VTGSGDQTPPPSEDDERFPGSSETDAREKSAGRRRRGVTISLGVVVAVLVAVVALLEVPARRPPAPIARYVAGVSSTSFSPTSLRGGCELWIGFLENGGSSSVKLEHAHVLARDNLTVTSIALVPATPAANGVELLGCQHDRRYPITPPNAHRISFRSGAMLPPKQFYAVVVDVLLPSGARLINGSIDGVRFDYQYQGWAYTFTTSGGRFCTTRSESDAQSCATALEP
jgi:hypothetical protein